ncbi:MAG: hypothetical protein AAFQ58_11125 [Pseudomonadota bacterium]
MKVLQREGTTIASIGDNLPLAGKMSDCWRNWATGDPKIGKVESDLLS